MKAVKKERVEDRGKRRIFKRNYGIVLFLDIHRLVDCDVHEFKSTSSREPKLAEKITSIEQVKRFLSISFLTVIDPR